MKHLAFSILILSAILASGQENNFSKKDVKNHCVAFINVLKCGDLNKSLDFFDPDYVQLQHNNMLSGNTSKFISEFIAGNSNHKSEDDVFIVPKMADIISIKVKKTKFDIEQESGIAEIEVKLNNGTKYKTSLMLIIGNDNKLYFVGAMG